MQHTHPANRSLLFSSQPSSDIPQHGTAHPGSKTARFRGGPVQVAAEISGTARLYNPARHRRDGEVPDNPYQHKNYVHAVGVVYRVVGIALQLQNVVPEHQHLELGEQGAEQVAHRKPQIDGDIPCEPLPERGLEAVPHAEGERHRAQYGEHDQEKGPYGIYQQRCRREYQFQQAAERITDFFLQIVHPHFHVHAQPRGGVRG